MHQGRRGDLLRFLGCSLEPPTFASAIKCHQKSTSNSAGSSVGSLAPPRATPRLGGVYVPCQYCFPTRPARARPSVGGQSPTPAPRQLPRSPPRGRCSDRLPALRLSFVAHKSSSRQNEIGTFVLLRSLHTRYRDPVWHTGMNRVDQVTRVLSDIASFVTRRSPALELLRERGYTGPRNNSLTQSMFGPVSRDTSLCESMFGVHKRAVCDLRRCVLCFLSPYLAGDLKSRLSRYEVEKGTCFRGE
jgi:hypothetical protein